LLTICTNFLLGADGGSTTPRAGGWGGTADAMISLQAWEEETQSECESFETPESRTGRSAMHHYRGVRGGATSALVGLATLVIVTAASAGAPDIVWERVDAHSGGATAVCFSADGEIVVSGGGSAVAAARFWRASDGEPIGSIDVVGENANGIKSVGLSPDGELLVIGTLVSGYVPGGRAEVHSTDDGSLLFYLGGCHAAISPLGDLVAGGGGGVNRYVEVCALPGGATVTGFHHDSYILDVAWSPDGLRVASCGTNNEVRLWNVADEVLERTFAPHANDVSCIAFSPDGALLAAGEGGWDSPVSSSIRIWRVADGELVRTLEGHGYWVGDVAFSPSGQTLISSGRNAATGSPSLRRWRVADGALLEDYDEQLTGGAAAARFNPAGGTFAYGRGDGNLLAAAYTEGSASVGETVPANHALRLRPATPNPFRSASSVWFHLMRESHALLTVHDPSGRRVAVLAEGAFPAGDHRVEWSGRDGNNRRVSPGVYFIRFATAEGQVARRVVVTQ
jgi:hypothetical protein